MKEEIDKTIEIIICKQDNKCLIEFCNTAIIIV